jgi:MoxR-like ATPase
MFRDDANARAEREAALEREAQRVRRLEERVRELEQENRELRAALAAGATAKVDVQRPDQATYMDAKLEQYIQDIVAATRNPSFADRILSGALPIDALRIADSARARARDLQRAYVVPDDVKVAARDVLIDRIILREGFTDVLRVGRRVSVIDELLDAIAVP